MNKIKYIVILLSVAFFSYGDGHKAHSHELSCYECWELSFGLGKGKIVEEHGTEKHTVRGDLWHLHGTKGLSRELLGIPIGYGIGLEGFLDSDIDHYKLHAGIVFFLSEDFHFSIGPALGYAKHGEEEHEEGEEEEEEEEHSDDWETEFGYHAELCGHLGHWNDYTIGIFVGYGESDADVCSEYGLSIGRHF